MLRSWRLSGSVVVCGAAVAAVPYLDGSGGVALIEFAIFVLMASLVSPLAFPKSLTAGEAQRRSADDARPVIYWRPGCRYCLRLRLRLGGAGRRAHWVNIWRDPAAAATVRAATGGDETVPTVV